MALVGRQKSWSYLAFQDEMLASSRALPMVKNILTSVSTLWARLRE